MWHNKVSGAPDLRSRVHPDAALTPDTQFAGNFGAGIEFRFGREGRWGIHAEVRDFISDFDLSGVDGTQNDVIYTGGISLTL